MIMVETLDLTRCYGRFTAVDKLNISIEGGDVFGLVGPNGAGKTTTIKMLTTLLPPTSGTALVAGFDVRREQKKVQNSIGYVPQMLSADGNLTGYENLLVFAKLYGMKRRDRPREIHGALEFMGLGDAAGKLVKHYSGGMVRRLEIAQSLLHRPKVVFLDEPTTGLDPVARSTVWEHIHKIRNDFGTTVLITTHLMEEAESLCDRVGIMSAGRLVIEGPPQEIIAAAGCSTLNEAFAHFTGHSIEIGVGYRELKRTRDTARRLG
jgi:ABC-2 type transport system ATP-binding protein